MEIIGRLGTPHQPLGLTCPFNEVMRLRNSNALCACFVMKINIFTLRIWYGKVYC